MAWHTQSRTAARETIARAFSPLGGRAEGLQPTDLPLARRGKVFTACFLLMLGPPTPHHAWMGPR